MSTIILRYLNTRSVLTDVVREGVEQCHLDPELVLLHDGLLVVTEAARLLSHDRVFLAPDQVSCSLEQVRIAPPGSKYRIKWTKLLKEI